MVNFFSKRGDQGETDQLGKGRVSKSHIRIQVVGAVDEASAALGLARAQTDDSEINDLVKAIQLDLYCIMTQIALEEPQPDLFPDLESSRIAWLEGEINRYGENLERPNGFILPGENTPSAAFGLARTIVRRAERQLVSLNEEGLLSSSTALPYLNRLSSLCYVMELHTSQNPPAGNETYI